MFLSTGEGSTHASSTCSFSTPAFLAPHTMHSTFYLPWLKIPLFVRQAAGGSRTGSAGSGSAGGLRKKRITRRVGYARGDDDDAQAQPAARAGAGTCRSVYPNCLLSTMCVKGLM